MSLKSRHLNLSLKLALLLCSDDDHASYLSQEFSLLKHVHGGRLTDRCKQFCGDNPDETTVSIVAGIDVQEQSQNAASSVTNDAAPPTSNPARILTYKLQDNSRGLRGVWYSLGLTEDKWEIEGGFQSDFLMCPDRVYDYMVKIFAAAKDLIDILDFNKVPIDFVNSFLLSNCLVLREVIVGEDTMIPLSMCDLQTVSIKIPRKYLAKPATNSESSTIILKNEPADTATVTSSTELNNESDIELDICTAFTKEVLSQAIAIVIELIDYGLTDCNRFYSMNDATATELVPDNYIQKFDKIKAFITDKDICIQNSDEDPAAFISRLQNSHSKWRADTISGNRLQFGIGGDISKAKLWTPTSTRHNKKTCSFDLVCFPVSVLGGGSFGVAHSCEASFRIKFCNAKSDESDDSPTLKPKESDFNAGKNDFELRSLDCVVKFFEAEKNTDKSVVDELELTQARRHKNLIKCYGSYVFEPSSQCIDLSKYLPRTILLESFPLTLSDAWEKFEAEFDVKYHENIKNQKMQNLLLLIREQRASEVAAQIIEGLCALHDPGNDDPNSEDSKTVVVHRDLGVANIGMTEAIPSLDLCDQNIKPIEQGTVKIFDFGKARQLPSDGSALIKADPERKEPFSKEIDNKAFAPEMIDNSDSAYYSTPADIYMAGVALFDLLCTIFIRSAFPGIKHIPYPGADYTSPLFYDENKYDIDRTIKNKPEAQRTYVDWIKSCSNSEKVEKLIIDMLNQNPAHRPSAQQCLEMVNSWRDDISSKVKDEYAKHN